MQKKALATVLNKQPALRLLLAAVPKQQFHSSQSLNREVRIALSHTL